MDPRFEQILSGLGPLAKVGAANWTPTNISESISDLQLVAARRTTGSESLDDVVRAVVSTAIESVLAPWSGAATEYFGFGSLPGHNLVYRQQQAGNRLGRSGRWLRGPHALLGESPEEHIVAMVAGALLADERVAVARARAHEAFDASVPTITNSSPLADLVTGLSRLPRLPLDETHPFLKVGLEPELRRVLAEDLYRPYCLLNERATFLSVTPTLDLRRYIDHHEVDPDVDLVYVISRADEGQRSVQQDDEEWNEYVEHLTISAGVTKDAQGRPLPLRDGQGLNHRRVVITSGIPTQSYSRIQRDLEPLHKKGWICQFPKARLTGRLLSAFKFGCLVSKHRGYAMITVPGQTAGRDVTDDLAAFLRSCPDLKPHPGGNDAPPMPSEPAMRAIVTSDSALIAEFIDEFELLLKHPLCVPLPTHIERRD
jgi:hypothetical protein